MTTPAPVHLAARDARRIAVAAQGLDRSRPGPAGRRAQRSRLLGCMDTLGTVQVDAVNVLARTQFLVPFARIGPYDPDLLLDLTGPGRPWFEYWGHAASLLPVDAHPLLGWKRDQWRADQEWHTARHDHRRRWRDEHGGYLADVLAEVTARGPMTAADLSDPRRQTGEWWERRSIGREALELLFGEGVLAAWRTPSFARVYDLADRVLPPEVLARPDPGEAASARELVARAARSLGVATADDLADYFHLRPAAARAAVAELAEDGHLQPAAVEGWDRPAWLVPGTAARPVRRRGGTLLSPFDSLIWHRPRALRLFGLHYRIGIYTPAHRRTRGYYALPLLVGDRIVARLDLKSERGTGTLSVQGAWTEEGHQPGPAAEAGAGELRRLAAWLGLERVAVRPVGDLSGPLRAAVGASTGPG